MKLTGLQHKHLEQALLSAFQTHEALTRIVRQQLNENLEAIAHGGNLSSVVFDLINWAESTGRLEELISKAREANPSNTELRAFDALLAQTLPSNRIKYFHSSTLPAKWASRVEIINQLVEYVQNRNKHLILVRGIGGSGKSSVVKKLLIELTARGFQFEGVFWFSFYMDDDVDHFFAAAGQHLIPHFKPADHPSPFDKSMMLREALSQKNYLLVLDGMEAILNTTQDSPNYGAIRDRSLKDLLRGVCIDQQRTIIIITSRDPLTELAEENGYEDFPLPPLETEAAITYMLDAGVIGDRHELALICDRFGNHPLTLSVLADYLCQPPNNGRLTGIGGLADIPIDTPQAAKLNAILTTYLTTLNKSEWYFISRLALFRFGARNGALSLMATDENGVVCDTSNPTFRKTLRRLKRSALLEVTISDESFIYSLHPLIKEYVKSCLSPEEKIAIHTELLRYARKVFVVATELSSLQDMQPFLDLYYHLIGSEQYGKAFSIIRTKSKPFLQSMRLFSRLFCWGHYSLTYDFLLSPLLEAHQNQKWKPSPEKLSYLYRQAGNVMAKAKSTTEAERLYKIAIEAASDNLASISNPVQQYLCELYIEAGRFNQAQQVLSELKTLTGQAEPYSKSYRIIGREGYINAALGKTSEAINQLTQAIQSAGDKQDGDEGYQCLFYRVLGDLYVNIENYQEAWQAYEHGLKITRGSINVFKDYEGHILRGMADIHRLQGNAELARRLYNEALKISSTTGYLWLKTEVLLGIANLFLSDDDIDLASLKTEEALQIAKNGGWLVPQMQCHILLSQIAIIEGQLLIAGKQLESAVMLSQDSGHYWSRLDMKRLEEQILEGR